MTDYFCWPLWQRAGGEVETQSPSSKPAPSLDVLERTEWSPRFERLMRNRLILGAMRYAPLHQPNTPQFDRVSSAIRRLQHYAQTGNTELLVDVANLCLVEFEEGIHPLKHWAAVDDGEHVGEK